MTEIDHSSRGHARVSPSQFNNRKLCEGWLPEPDDPKKIHPVTAEGTRCHEAMETGDDSQLQTEWEEQYVAICREYVAKLPRADWERIEPKLDILGGRSHGYADLLRCVGNTADLVDWKFGWNQVEDAETNLQGIGYTLGVFELYPSIAQVTVHFVMPRLGKVSVHTFDRSDVDRLRVQVAHILDRAENPDPKNFQASWKACAYCARKPICPVVVSKVAEACSSSGLPLPETNLAEATPEELSFLRDFADVAEDWARKVKEYVLSQRLHGGIDIPGWELTFRKGARKVDDGNKLVEIARAFGLTESDIVESSKLYLTKLEKKVRDIQPPKDMAHELPEDFEHEKLLSYGADGRLSVDPDIAGLTKAQRAKLFTFAASDAVVEGDETPVLKRVK